MKFVERGAWFCSLLNMAVEPLAMCYPGLAGGTLRAATASIQNDSGLPQGLAGISVAG